MDVERFACIPIGHLENIAGTDRRTGLPSRHVAFVPGDLADEPQLTSETWRAVSRAAVELGRLDQVGRIMPDVTLLRRPYLRREAQSTSNLEGTYVPLEEVLGARADEVHGASALLREVLNYEQAANMAYDAVADGHPIGVALLAEIQRTIVRGTPDEDADLGRIRTTQVAMGAAGLPVQQARFIPMPPGPSLKAALRRLMDWVGGPGLYNREPIVGAAMAHYQFETLHPFTNANGRVGRFLIVLQLLARGVISQPILAVSPWFVANRQLYQDLLGEVSASGAWDAWVRLFADGLAASAADAAERANAIFAIRDRYRGEVARMKARGTIRDVVDLLIETPFVTVSGLADKLGVTFAAVNTAVAKLVDVGVLEVQDGPGRGRQFVARDMVKAIVAPATWAV